LLWSPIQELHLTDPTAFGRFKGTTANTAFWAVTFVSDRDFSLRKTSHIINAIPPPPVAAERL